MELHVVCVFTHLHSSTKANNQVQGRLFLDVVVAQGATILKLLTSEDKPLLIRENSLLVLDLRLDQLNGVRALDLKSDSFTSESLHKNLQKKSVSDDTSEKL